MTFNILSIDGGGIRGVIPLVMLQTIEQIIQQKHGQTLQQYFQMAAGTSTGSIVAAGLAIGKRPEELLQIYLEHGERIFPYQKAWSPQRLSLILHNGISAPKYSPDSLTELLHEQFGDTRVGTVDDTLKLLIPIYDTHGRRARFIKSYPTSRHSVPYFRDVPLWEATLCSSSAPTYFPAHALRVGDEVFPAIDGGVVANNPTACAVADAMEMVSDPAEIRVLSLGTGATTRPITLEEATEWGALEWAVPVIDVLFDGSQDVTRYIVERLIDGQRSLRLQFNLDCEEWDEKTLNDDMDDARPVNVQCLARACGKYLDREARQQLEAFL